MATMATAPSPDRSRDRGGYRHEALVYRDPAEYVTFVTAFVQAGLAAGEPVLVAVPADRIQLLQTALGGQAQAVRWADTDDVGHNPARLIAEWTSFVDGAGPGACRGVGETLHTGRDAAELDECRRHERLLDRWFDGCAFTLLCPYDAALGSDALHEARTTHRGLHQDGWSAASPEYRATGLLDGLFDGALVPGPSDAPACRFDEDNLYALRRFVDDQGRTAGLAAERSADLVLAVDEIAANSLTHGGGGGTVRCWSTDGRFVCELAGSGTLDDPRVGRIRPAPDRTGGRGLWLANQFCDLVQLRNTPDGLVVRLRFDLPTA